MTDDFAGDKKAPMVSPLAKIEKKFILATVDKVLGWIEGHHLTWMTLAWSLGLIGFGVLAFSITNAFQITYLGTGYGGQ